MSEIGVNPMARNMPPSINNIDELSKGLNLDEKSVQLVKEVVGLLATDRSVRVTNTAGNPVKETGTATGATGIPALDSPADEAQVEQNLERLIAYLQLETDLQQTELAKERIELLKGEIDNRHAEQREKLQDTLKEMDEAAKSRKVSKIFGWLMAAVAVVSAIVTTVVTGGAAAAFAIAGAVAAVGIAVAQECGAIDKLTEMLTNALKDAGMSKMAAQIVAGLIISAAMIAATLGPSAGAAIAARGASAAVATASAVSAAAKTTGQLVQTGVQIGGMVVGLVSTGVGVSSTVNSYNAGISQAELTEANKFLEIIRQLLEENQKELQDLLAQIQSGYSNIVEILNSEVDVQREIAQQIAHIGG